MSVLIEKGKTVLLPFGDNERYDLVVEENNKFEKIQCKNGLYKNGTVKFRTCSSYGHRGRKPKNYRGQIDTFGVYCKQLNKVYFVPVLDVGMSEGVLRIEPTKNRQELQVRWAKKYEV